MPSLSIVRDSTIAKADEAKVQAFCRFSPFVDAETAERWIKIALRDAESSRPVGAQVAFTKGVCLKPNGELSIASVLTVTSPRQHRVTKWLGSICRSLDENEAMLVIHHPPVWSMNLTTLVSAKLPLNALLPISKEWPNISSKVNPNGYPIFLIPSDEPDVMALTIIFPSRMKDIVCSVESLNVLGALAGAFKLDVTCYLTTVNIG